jgi:uncharacterized protein YbaR (Trm112 family)
MPAILNCPADHNEFFEVVETAYKQGNIRMVANEYIEFMELLCTSCRRIMVIEKKAIKRDGRIWKYVK